MSRPATYRSVLAVREFRAVWIAHLLSVAGDQLARVALTVLVFDRTSSAGLAALTFALTFLPDFIGGAALGHVADRYAKRTVMVVTDLARAAVVAVMAVPALPLVVRLGLLVVVQLAAAPFSAARQATLPDLLRGDRLTVGFAVISLTYQVALVLGFGVGAAVVAELGTSGALLADAGTFLLSALVIRFGLGPHSPGGRPMGRSAPSGWSAIAGGWRIVGSNARLRALLAVACCSGLYVVPEGLAVPYATQISAGTTGAGWLLAANPLGTVIGILVIKRLPRPVQQALLGPLVIATSLVLLPTGWAPGLAVTVTLWTVSGALSAHDVITQSSYVAAAPEHQRGQAIGVAIASLRAAQGLGIVLAGLVAQLLPASAVIAAAAATGVVAAAFATIAWSRARPTP